MRHDGRRPRAPSSRRGYKWLEIAIDRRSGTDGRGCAGRPGTDGGHADGSARVVDVTFQLGGSGSGGGMSIWPAAPDHDSHYYAGAVKHLSVTGTRACPNGTTARVFLPYVLLRTALRVMSRPVPADGVLAGTDTQVENERQTATFAWRLVPAG
jgi:hypothetical protein